MRRKVIVLAVVSLFLLVLWLPSWLPASGYTRLQLTDAGTGRKILSAVLRDGDDAVLTWTNSLFGQRVTETFVARGGLLIQDSVTFLDPQDPHAAPVTARDIEDLYHSGGSFTASGLARPFSRIVYRVGEIGNPVMVIGDARVVFKSEVGFGGQIVLQAGRVSLYEQAADCWLALRP